MFFGCGEVFDGGVEPEAGDDVGGLLAGGVGAAVVAAGEEGVGEVGVTGGVAATRVEIGGAEVDADAFDLLEFGGVGVGAVVPAAAADEATGDLAVGDDDGGDGDVSLAGPEFVLPGVAGFVGDAQLTSDGEQGVEGAGLAGVGDPAGFEGAEVGQTCRFGLAVCPDLIGRDILQQIGSGGQLDGHEVSLMGRGSMRRTGRPRQLSILILIFLPTRSPTVSASQAVLRASLSARAESR